MSNTGIRIETVQEVSDNGEKGFRITKIKALQREDLPSLYLNNGPAAVLETDCMGRNPRLYLRNNGGNIFFSGRNYIFQAFYTVEDMKKINAHIEAAGQHLADVNRELAKKRQAWNGKAVFIDGVQIQKIDNQSTQKNKESVSLPLAEKIAELWGDGRLLYRNNKGQIKLLK